MTNTRDLFVVTFSGSKLANKDGMFGTSDPFLEISRYPAVCTIVHCVLANASLSSA